MGVRMMRIRNPSGLVARTHTKNDASPSVLAPPRTFPPALYSQTRLSGFPSASTGGARRSRGLLQLWRSVGWTRRWQCATSCTGTIREPSASRSNIPPSWGWEPSGSKRRERGCMVLLRTLTLDESLMCLLPSSSTMLHTTLHAVPLGSTDLSTRFCFPTRSIRTSLGSHTSPPPTVSHILCACASRFRCFFRELLMSIGTQSPGASSWTMSGSLPSASVRHATGTPRLLWTWYGCSVVTFECSASSSSPTSLSARWIVRLLSETHSTKACVRLTSPDRTAVSLQSTCPGDGLCRETLSGQRSNTGSQAAICMLK
mmetsp:Transcript_34265/g.81730  ORF Transcript_34265/g.81730 Transcript_34265/m.81730 type:complete len:315 (-) Transcript_34265:899-1843(-)